MIEQKAVIQNVDGIHCRPSTVIIRSVAGYRGTIEVVGERGRTALQSILELMAMELFPGSEVTIRVEGPEAERTCRELVTLFERHFDFPPQS